MAALGLFTVMVFALVYHITKGEYESLGMNVILGAIAFFIAWGRYKKVPIAEKNNLGKYLEFLDYLLSKNQNQNLYYK